VLEIASDDEDDEVVRWAEGSTHECSADHHREVELYFRVNDIDITAYACQGHLDAAADEVGALQDDLEDACSRAGFGAAVAAADDADHWAWAVADFVKYVREGCRCDAAGKVRLGWPPPHWGCPRRGYSAQLRAREGAVRLVAYDYPEGSTERAAAKTLAPNFSGTPDELHAAIAALHAAPQRPGSPR